jgi:hypothetical protein
MYIHLTHVVRYRSIFAHKEGKKVLVLHTATARRGSATHPIFSRTSSSILAMESCNGHAHTLLAQLILFACWSQSDDFEIAACLTGAISFGSSDSHLRAIHRQGCLDTRALSSKAKHNTACGHTATCRRCREAKLHDVIFQSQVQN